MYTTVIGLYPISLSLYLSLSISIYLSIYLSLSLYIYIYTHTGIHMSGPCGDHFCRENNIWRTFDRMAFFRDKMGPPAHVQPPHPPSSQCLLLARRLHS